MSVIKKFLLWLGIKIDVLVINKEEANFLIKFYDLFFTFIKKRQKKSESANENDEK